MSRYAHSSSLLFLYFSLFFFHSLVFAQLSSNQRTTIINVSELLPNNTTWSITKDPNPCSWKGISCSPNNSSITHLSLSGFGLSASDILPPLCQIDSLESLDLSNNHLSSIPDGFITGCGGIDGLNLLNFSKNKLSGSLPTFSGFVGLQFLDLSFNYLNGNIDLQLDALVSLKSLNLSSNHFNGSVPTNLGKSMVLEKLILSINFFQGEIPKEISNYRNLTLIDFSVNHFSGSLPNQIAGLSKLEVLIISSNNLSGPIPNVLSNITTLVRFAANQNNFSGNIPNGISRYLRNLDLSYNKLSGPIPSDLLSQSNLQTVDLSYNLLEGSIPANISTSLLRLRLGSNGLSGVIPSPTFATLETLTYLELENNSLTGSIPSELGSCQKLALLNLAQNKLSGVLPEQLGNLSHLQVMKLQSNNLVGEIPTQITQLPQLSILNISWNSLSGSIPSSISGLQNLTNLNLQGNNLNGSIPHSIFNLGDLLELQLGKNKLSGPIPMLPQSLQIALNLSNNFFEGTIPATLSQLEKLEVLDLSNNKFSGEIPDFLTEIATLTELILSNNHLSGVLPQFKQWVVVNVSGNNVTIPVTPNPEQAKKRKSVAVAVVLAVVAAVLAVGIVAMVALLISRRNRGVNDEQLKTGEVHPFPQVVQGSLLTANGIHRANIDFTKAMEATTNPSNVMQKTRFSTYYKAVMPSGASYSVKKLNWSDKIFQLGNHELFGQELGVLGKLSNSNVMTPLAYVLTADSAYLIYEYALKGTLFDVLHGSIANALDWASRYSIAIGVAQGLAFLHGCSSGPVLLLDLSSKSIMLKSLKEPQIGEIELCKVIDPSKSTGSLSTIAGSVGYIPPEYAYTMRVTMAGNVYSFGVILLELLTGKQAVSEGVELAKRALKNSMRQDKLDRILDFSVSRTSLAVRSQMVAVLKVALSCVSVSPAARPKMKSVLRMLLNAR